MNTIQRSAVLALALATSALAFSACGGSGNASSGDKGDYVDGGTFHLAVTDDPGSLDPQQAVTGVLVQLNQLAYDSLVAVDPDGEVVPQLAESWELAGDTLTMQVREGVTCSDGAEFTAQTAADNLSWIADPANQSQYLGIYLPPGAVASAKGSTLTIELAGPAPFVLNGLSSVSMVCESGLADRAALASETHGTGPFVLTETSPGSSYVYEVREDYAWGPDGAATSETGTPDAVNVHVVANDTTAANQLLTGELNAATVTGAGDADRVAAAGLESHEVYSLAGEQSFNHAPGHPTSDSAVRMALTQALDLEELQTVLTSGQGEPATRLAVSAPSACDGNSVEGAVPGTDVEAARAALDDAGWVEGSDGARAKDGQELAITFAYANFLGPGASAAAELAASAWEEIGVDVDLKGITLTDFTALTASGDWDVLWVPFNVTSPDQLVAILSGAAPPDGNNFAAIDNDDYVEHVTKAMALPGAEGCAEWLAAESALFEQADLVPFANTVLRTFATGATFELAGTIVPTSIRMLG